MAPSDSPACPIEPGKGSATDKPDSYRLLTLCPRVRGRKSPHRVKSDHCPVQDHTPRRPTRRRQFRNLLCPQRLPPSALHPGDSGMTLAPNHLAHQDKLAWTHGRKISINSFTITTS